MKYNFYISRISDIYITNNIKICVGRNWPSRRWTLAASYRDSEKKKYTNWYYVLTRQTNLKIWKKIYIC